MADERKSPGKVEAKASRDKRLAEALRANLRRRKAAEPAERKPDGGRPVGQAKDGPGEENGG